MNRIWIVAADTARARIFRTDETGEKLDEVEDLINPQTRFPDRDLVTDTRGRTGSGGSPQLRHAYGDDHAEQDSLRDVFAREVVRRLEERRARDELERFHVIAERGFLGLLRAHFGRELQRCLAGEVGKSQTADTADALRALLPRRL